MGKALKIIGICVGVLLALLVIAVAVVPYVIPWGSILTGAVSDGTGRPASVQEVSLSLWGGLEVEVKGLVVQDLPRWGPRPLLKLERLRLQADLLPLLASKVVVRDAAVQGLEVSLVKDPRGRINWQDMPAHRVGEATAEPEAPGPLAEGNVLVSRARVEGARLYLRNLATGQSGELPLNKLELTSDLGAGGASGRLDLEMPGLQLKVTGRSQGLGADLKVEQALVEMEMDLAPLAQRLSSLQPGLKGAGKVRFRLRAAGPPSGLAIKAQGTAQNLLLSSRAMANRPFRLSNARLQADLTLDLPGNLAQVRRLEFVSQEAGLSYRLTGRLGWGESLGQSDARYHQETDLAKLSQVLAPVLPWPLSAQGTGSKDVRLKGVGQGAMELVGQSRAQGVVVQSPLLAEPYRDPKFLADYTLLLSNDGQRLEIKRFDLASSAARLGLTGRLKKQGRKIEAKLKLAGQFLDLNRLPLGQPRRQARPVAQGKSRQAAKAAGQAAAPAQGKPTAADPAARLRQALAGKELEADIRLDRVLLASYRFSNLQAKLELNDGKLKLERLSCGVLDGQVDLAGSLDSAQAQPASRMQITGQGLRVTPKVFRDLQRVFPLFALPVGSLSGVFSLRSEMQGRGLQRETLLASLQGKGELRARDGVTIGLDFLENMPGGGLLWGQVLGRLPRRFAKLRGEYTLGGGRVNYDVVMLTGDQEVNAQIKGSTGLLDESVQAQLKISGQALGRDLRRVLAPDGTFPIGLGGTLQKPVPRVELPAGGLSPAENLLRGILQR